MLLFGHSRDYKLDLKGLRPIGLLETFLFLPERNLDPPPLLSGKNRKVSKSPTALWPIDLIIKFDQNTLTISPFSCQNKGSL